MYYYLLQNIAEIVCMLSVKIMSYCFSLTVCVLLVPNWLDVCLFLTFHLNLLFGSSNLILSSCFVTLSSFFTGFANRILLFPVCILSFDCYSFLVAVSPLRIRLWVSCLASCALQLSRCTLHVSHCVLHFIHFALWVICYPLWIAHWGFPHMNSCFYIGFCTMRLLY